MQKITQDELQRLLHYNPTSGEFTWRSRGNPKFDNKLSGKVAGTKMDKGSGKYYWKIAVNSVQYLAHQLAFLYMEGYIPDFIDHRDSDGLNNRWSNLRIATSEDNNRNRRQSSRNTSGMKGVSWDKSRNKWVAHIMAGDKKVFKRFTCKGDAEEFIIKTREILHGEFTNHG